MIAIGSDHGGYELKELVKKHLDEIGEKYDDLGCYSLESVDYPAFGRAVAQAVAKGEADKGIVICTTGIGISIVANKVKGIRCALCADTVSARLTREHNDANVLCMGAQIIGFVTAREITKTFLSNPFVGGKHKVRVDMLE